MNLVICGTGEYVTGFVNGAPARSDKSRGVVALCAFDLRSRGFLDAITLVGTQGTKGPALREHVESALGADYRDLDTSFALLPPAGVERDPRAYRAAIDALAPRQGVWIYTPDDTHFELARYALEHEQHVLLAKPGATSPRDAKELSALARSRGLLLMVDYHKRWDPMYRDARSRAAALGDFSYFHAYMSQPRSQLDTFRNWVGRGSDISWYLNSHHLDFHCWLLRERAVPTGVTAFRSTGVAPNTDDIITLVVEWRNVATGNLATGVYTASWIAPTGAEVHSQQRFHYVAHGGELRVDQAHRGYEMARDGEGLRSVNPLFFTYEPDDAGRFQGRGCYGYQPFLTFVETVARLDAGTLTLDDVDPSAPLLERTVPVLTILEAGRRSLESGRRIDLIDLADAAC